MAQFHAITPRTNRLDDLFQQINQIYDLIDFIHLRNREWTADQYLYLIDRLREIDPYLQKVIINDRIDLALVSTIPRVHLPSHGIQVEKIQLHFPKLSFGCSIHHRHEAVEKDRSGASYFIFGHIFKTKSKAGQKPRGLQELQEVVDAVSTPIIAIGGIEPTDVPSILETGAKGIAVMSGIFSSEHSRDRALDYLEQLHHVREEQIIETCD